MIVSPQPMAVDYRAGDFSSFRRALLQARPGESALAQWRPSSAQDLALQLVDWWAYLADVLTFYNERAFSEAMLRTAVLPEDVRRIIRLLGYRPRPGIGATGVVAALVESARPFTVPRGLPIQGRSAPGQPAQIFETDADVEIGLLGKRLPPSARLPPSGSGAQGTWSGASPVDSRGRIVNHLPAERPASPGLTVDAAQAAEFTLAGVVTVVKPGDTMILLRRDWDGGPSGYALLRVGQVTPRFDVAGGPVTNVSTVSAHSLPAGSRPADYRLLKATKLAHLWLYHERYPGSSNPTLVGSGTVAQVVETIFDPLHLFTGGVSTEPPQDPRVLTGVWMQDPSRGAAHLEAVTRGISAGDPVLFEKRIEGGITGIFGAIASGLPAPAGAALKAILDPTVQLVKVTGYAEDIWYANPPEMDRIGQGPPVGPPAHELLGNAPAPIPIPHSRINFVANPLLDVMPEGDQALRAIVVHYGWQDVGELVEAPPESPATAVTVPLASDAVAGSAPVLIEDATGAGTPGWLGETTIVGGAGLRPPLRALLHLLPVSRGQTVEREVLGSGDPILVRQEFVLARSPLTYLPDPDPRFPTGYRSTLQVRVDGVEWTEVPSFYGQPPGARVFTTREDEAQNTHVRFGDGENGARLPAGTDNVIARYRVGSGEAVPAVGTLTSLLRSQPGLTRIVNPVAPGGGADPDPPGQLRRYAPRSVLAFGRAVSGDDYEAVAAQTPGVKRARAFWSWDAASQRTAVKVFVGDDEAAVAAASAALTAFADPNRPAVVALATPLYPHLSLQLEVDPAWDPDMVQARVTAALLDPQAEPFGTDVVDVGRVVYDSQIHEACLRVAGVLAVRALSFAIDGVAGAAERHVPPEGSFFLLRGDHLHITAEAGRHGP